MSLLRLASLTTKPGETGGAALGSCKSIITVPYEHFHISFVNMANYRNRGAGGKTKGAWRESQKGQGWRERGKEGGGGWSFGESKKWEVLVPSHPPLADVDNTLT